MKIILHIGCEKTGSTSIQHALRGDREALRAEGILYPALFGSDNHMEIAAACADDEVLSELRLIELGKANCTLDEYRERLVDQLADECRAADFDKVVLSNEHCHSRINTPSAVARLKELLHSISGDVEVVVYLRRQDRLALSLYSTKLKLGGDGECFPLASNFADMPYFDFGALISRYEAVFGRDKVRIGIFEQERLEGGDVVSDFFQRCGLPLTTTSRKRWNSSLPIAQALFLARFNEEFPLLKNGQINPERGPIYSKIRNTFPEGPPYLPERAVAERFYSLFMPENRRLKRLYFPELERESLFEEDFSDYPIDGSKRPLDTEEMFAFLSAIWRSVRH